jgi:hypothetical protein
MPRLITLATLLAAALAPGARQTPTPPAQTETDQYARIELLAPDTSSFKIVYEVSATMAGAREYVDPIPNGVVASQVAAFDMMTGAPLVVMTTPTAIRVALARPVPPNGQGRVRIEKTYKDPASYARAGDRLVFRQPRAVWRTTVVLPAGFAVVACNVPSQVLAESDGRVMLSFMRQAPGDAGLIVEGRDVAPVGPTAAPTPLTNARSWESPPSQGPTERARLTERAHQDRDIVYFLKDPSTNAFSLYHDYTESRPGTDKYLNVVRAGSRVSETSAYILDTGEVLKDETLRGEAIAKAGIDIGQGVTPDTEVVVIHFTPVKPGQSVRLRISETYTAPESYRLEGPDLVFERSLGRARNSVVLPAGWHLTALSIPAVIRETDDHRVRMDFVNGRPDGLDVFLKARRMR